MQPVARYRKVQGVPLGTRLFLGLRWRLTPYPVMASKVPLSGRVLDLGCGHGLLSMAMALQAPGRTVLGIDHDEARIELARRASREIPNLELRPGSLLTPPAGPFSGITAIDVMHYFEPEAQREILRRAHESLEPGGCLLVREVDPTSGLASRFNRFYEKLATGTGFTRAGKKGLHFRSPDGWKTLLSEAGFEVTPERCSHFLFADILYVCRKN
jgi:chemotaxis methyl-accepting protein methylase